MIGAIVVLLSLLLAAVTPGNKKAGENIKHNDVDMLKFIHVAHMHTFAAIKSVKVKYLVKPIRAGHKDYGFTKEDWKYHDSYAGWHMAPGREVVHYKGKPVWQMSYQGMTVDGLSKEFIKDVFTFLKKALRSVPETMPFRGPVKFLEGEFVYEFKFEGDYKYFKGRESITYKGKEVFFQDVMGSIIV